MNLCFASNDACVTADIPYRLGTPCLLGRPFVPLHPEFHSITLRYNTTLPCHNDHNTSADKEIDTVNRPMTTYKDGQYDT